MADFKDRFKKKAKPTSDEKEDVGSAVEKDQEEDTEKKSGEGEEKDSPVKKKREERLEKKAKDNPNVSPSGGIEIKGKEIPDFEPTLRTEEAVAYVLDGDYSDAHEHIEIIEEFLQELYGLDEVLQELYGLDESLSIMQRRKRAQVMRRHKSRIKVARNRQMRRVATQDVLQRRARRGAINALKRRFAGGRSVNTLSASEKARVERMVAQRKKAVERIQRKMVRVKRELDRNRRRGKRK